MHNDLMVTCISNSKVDKLMDEFVYSIKDDPMLDRVLRQRRMVLMTDGSRILFRENTPKNTHGFDGRTIPEGVFRMEYGLKSSDNVKDN